MSEESDNKEYLAKIAKRRAFHQGEEATALFRDGESEKVFVRQLSIREVEADDFIRTLYDEPKFLELCCSKPEGWADGLTIDSHVELLKKAQGINHPIFLQWTERMKQLKDQLILKAATLAGSKATGTTSS